MKKTRSIAGIRWSLEQAGREFHQEPKKISRRLKAISELPGSDECFSTIQISKAVFGSLELERIRATAAQADAREHEVAQTRRDLVWLAAIREWTLEVGVNIRQKLLSMSLPVDSIDGVLFEVQRLMLKYNSAKTVCKRLGIEKLIEIKDDQS